MKVAIINNTAAGRLTEVHGVLCADVAKSEKRNKDNAWIIDVDSRVDLSHTYWNDQISDNCDPDSPEGWATAVAWLDEFNFLPCCGTLPVDHREEVFADEEEPAAHHSVPAATTVVTTWVGKKIASHVINTKTGTVAAKLEAAKPTKAGDRTVKLTAEEAEELRAICTDLEGVSGYGYSARTLRARLA